MAEGFGLSDDLGQHWWDKIDLEVRVEVELPARTISDFKGVGMALVSPEANLGKNLAVEEVEECLKYSSSLPFHCEAE